MFLFLNEFIAKYKLRESFGYVAVIEKLLKMFAEESLINQNAWSFLLLVICADDVHVRKRSFCIIRLTCIILQKTLQNLFKLSI